MKMDIETLERKYKNALERERYWKDKASDDYYPITDRLIELLKADPEMKWFILWLTAGAVASVGSLAQPSQTQQSQPNNQTYSGTQTGTDWLDIASLLSPGAAQANLAGLLFRSDNPVATMTLPGLVGDLSEGDISNLTLPGLAGKILKNASTAGSLSAIALAMIIIGRLNSGSGEMGKLLMAAL